VNQYFYERIPTLRVDFSSAEGFSQIKNFPLYYVGPFLYFDITGDAKVFH
jgi:hypothetical protein